MAGAGEQAHIALPVAGIEAFCRNDELEHLLDRDVDIVNRESIERSANTIRCNAVLNAARPIYVA